MKESIIKPKKFKFNFKEILSLLTETYNQWIDDKAIKMAASLSYYTIFSLTPLLIIVIALAGFIFGEEAARGEIVYQIQSLIGKDGAEVVQQMIQNSSEPTTGIFATFLSIIVLFLGSVGVFLELMESLNIIWGVEQRPGRGIKGFLRNRLASFSMVLGIAFLLLVSLLVSAFISGVNNYIGTKFSSLLPFIQILNILISFLITTLLFAMVYKYLPDVRIKWKYVTIGAAATSFLFTIGKYLIGLYIGNSSYSSSYGAAGSLVVLFIWVNYSSQILFFGAEFTQVFRNKYSDSPLEATRDAIIIPKVSELIKQKMQEEKKSMKRPKPI